MEVLVRGSRSVVEAWHVAVSCSRRRGVEQVMGPIAGCSPLSELANGRPVVRSGTWCRAAAHTAGAT